MHKLTRHVVDFLISKEASDLYLSVGVSPCVRVHGEMHRSPASPLSEDDVRNIMSDLLTTKEIQHFEKTHEFNTAITWENKWRMRINVFMQKQHTGIVIRRVEMEIPTLEKLGLPAMYGNLVMEKRGLILIVGQTGAGKSSTLAAMINHRNMNGSGHIITIEDPIEFEHAHKNCIITQRDVGIDTETYSAGLKNALRQMPDIIVIGEIRDTETMEHAIAFAETGHLCIATLHSNNTNQAIERIINFFPRDKRLQILMSLSLNLRAVLSQRLVQNVHGTRNVATEIMLNQGHIKDLILDGNIRQIREFIEKGRSSGMQLFEQALLELYEKNLITEETALAEADSPANLRVAMRQKHMEKYQPPVNIQTTF